MGNESKTRIMIGSKKFPVRFSYANVFTPRAMNEGDDPKYNVSILIDKKDKATVKKVKDAIKAAVAEGKSSKWGGKIPPKYHYPLRDGDEERPDDEAYAGHYFINANSKQKPGLVDADREEIIDAEEFYSGCYGRVTVNLYPFASTGNKGIGCGLNNLQKLKEGEPLGGATVSAFDDFDDDAEFETETEEVDDDDDLDGLL